MIPARFPANNEISTVRIIPMDIKSIIPFATIFPPSEAFFSPIFCPKNTVMPMERELTRFVSVIIICDPVDTPDTSAGSANFPTIIRSTAPYSDCRNNANSTGIANLRSGASILPSVKFFCSVMFNTSKKAG